MFSDRSGMENGERGELRMPSVGVQTLNCEGKHQDTKTQRERRMESIDEGAPMIGLYPSRKRAAVVFTG